MSALLSAHLSVLQMYVLVSILYELFFDFTKLFLQLVRAAYFCCMNKCKKIDWQEFSNVVDTFIKEMKTTLAKGSRDEKFMTVFSSRFNRWKKDPSTPFPAEWVKKTFARLGEGKYIVEITAKAGIAKNCACESDCEKVAP